MAQLGFGFAHWLKSLAEKSSKRARLTLAWWPSGSTLKTEIWQLVPPLPFRWNSYKNFSFWIIKVWGPCTTTIIRLCRQAAERNNRWRKRRRFQHQQDSKDHLFSCYSDLGMTDFSAIVWEEDFSQLLFSKTCLSLSDQQDKESEPNCNLNF